MRYDDDLHGLVEFAASRHNAFSTIEAATYNIAAHRLRRGEQRGELLRLHPKVWSFAALPRSPTSHLRAAVLAVPGSAATGPSAAWLHGWLDPPCRPQPWCPTHRSVRHRAADLHRWQRIDPQRDLAIVGGIPTLNRAAALCSLGSFVETTTLERCLDEFLRNESVRWLDETMRRLSAQKPGGVAALVRLRSAPHRCGPVPDSWFERVVARLVAVPALPDIELQHEVVVDGRRFRVDIACPALRLGVEAHSRSFHWGAAKEDADNVRDLHLSAAGWQLIYVTWSQVLRPDLFVEQFTATARARARQLGVRLPAA